MFAGAGVAQSVEHFTRNEIYRHIKMPSTSVVLSICEISKMLKIKTC